MAGFEFHSRRVHPALRPYVAEVTGYAYPGQPPALHRGLPSQYLTLVITLDEPLGLAWPGAPVTTYGTVVGGLHSTAVHISQSPNRSGIQLALRPAAARALLGLPPGELASMVVELDDVLGSPARAISERLRAAPTWVDRFDIVERVLLEHWADEPAPAPRAELGWAWRRLRETAGAVSVEELATEVGWSRRHLTDRFTIEFGLGPKVAGRVMRFEQAVGRLRRDPKLRLADLSAELGYADQAHLTREWNTIAGCSPRQWVAEEVFPNVQDQPAGAGAESGYEHDNREEDRGRRLADARLP
ncbi:AraC family transcriptional regulator [Kribbella turkmenica]|uniref:AraC family transcriptional regulator n=1 Tax=Kribbella turkmenica TaxID=2530375 RepID=A0A4R4XIK0_9ACTN|nr:AraC family transcriptional regulator [Kribbella turkmenica]TDD30332.1 AraC family transcriptional regulator [Kribbella turkmenica]